MKLLKYFIFILPILLLLNACVGDVDFDQANDLEFTPRFKIALVYFKLHDTDFIDQVTNDPVPLRLDFTNVDVFNNTDTSDKLEKAVLKFEIENTFNKDFTIDYILMDENDNALLTIPFTINQNENKTIDITYLKGTEDFENLIKTTKIMVIGNLLPNANTTNQQMFIHFKSVVDLYLNVKDV